jgi:FkbM family methyltransferase
MSYSQLGQEKYLNENFFKNKTNGVFVDIGAHDGITLSNTKFFEELGWQGICVEPIPEIFEKLKINRKCICEQYAVSDEDGIGEFLVLKGWTEMLSGLANEYVQSHVNRINAEISERGGSKEIIPINTIKLQTLLDRHNITYIDYLSVDTEGNELKILKSIDFNKTKVFSITVENNYNISDFKDYLIPLGFRYETNLTQDEVFINTKI